MIRPEARLYFKDERFLMTQVERMFLRILSFSIHAVLMIICAIFLISDIKWLFWTGVLAAMFLFDQFTHSGKANKSLQEKQLFGEINIVSYLTKESFVILEYVFERTLLIDGNLYLFLLKRLTERNDIRSALPRMDIDIKQFIEKVDKAFKESVEIKRNLKGNQKRKDILEKIAKISALSLDQALAVHNKFIDPKDIFAALGSCGDPGVVKIFDYFGIEDGDLENALLFSRFGSGWLKFLPKSLSGFVGVNKKIRHRVMNRSWSARPTPFLDNFSENLTDYASAGAVGFAVGHFNEYDRMVEILARSGRPNVLLIGEPGVGKESLVEKLAFKIVKDEVPASLFDKRIVKLNIGSLAAGAEQAELQLRLKKIIEEIVAAGNIILFIPDIHNLVKISSKNGFNAIDTLLPVINSDALSVIGTTHPREHKQFIDLQTDFSEAFEILRVQEISLNDSVMVLVYDAILLEHRTGIKITLGAVKKTVDLSAKYFREKLLPGSARDLLSEAASSVRGSGGRILNASEVVEVAQRRISVPLAGAGEDETQKLLNLEEYIHEYFVDQEEAVKVVARSLREYRSGLARRNGPIAAFLFVGPTGVGKTELSKILASVQFGSKKAMIRFDMSEYQEKQSITRFIGAADGSIGGSLTDAVAQKPYGLILFDELEKAHPDILNLFLQIFDEGRLTDGTGKIVSFENTVIIATSNAHSDLIKNNLEAGRNILEISEDVKKRLTEFFKPELLNRFSAIVVFKNLSLREVFEIAKILFNELVNDVKKSNGINLSFSTEVVDKIAQWGFDPVFGARPLRRVIEERIRSVLAEKILKKEIVKGSKVEVALINNELIFNVS